MRRTTLSLLAAALLSSTASAQIAQEDAKALKRGAERRALRQQLGIHHVGCSYTVTQVDIPAGVTGTGFMERIQVMTPCGFNPGGPDLPLIVAWNGYGLSAASFFNGMSDIPDEASARGWLVVAVTGLDDKSFGAPLAQKNVEAAIDHVIANYPVDEDRIYGVGWSAGGGAIAAFGARHLDPAAPMFAAIATNAGAYDLVDTYNNDTSPGMTTQTIMENAALFGGPPSGATLWNYLSSESLDHDPILDVESEATSQMRNLRNVPIYHVYSSDDTIGYLPDQSLVFSTYLAFAGAPITTQVFSGLVDPHDWLLFDAKTTLDFLQAHTAERAPDAFEVNADRDATFYWADVTQRTAQAFSPLACSVDDVTNHLDVLSLENVLELTLRPPAASFDPNVNFTLTVETADVGATTVRIEGVTDAPTYLLDYDVLYFDANWTHDDVNDVLTIVLYGPLTHEFSVRYDDYAATLTGDANVTAGNVAHLQWSGSTPSQPTLLLIGFEQGVVDLSAIDPNDDRNVLIGFSIPPVFLFGALDGAGQGSLDVFLPASLQGTKLRTQLLTYPGGATLIDEISPRHDVTID